MNFEEGFFSGNDGVQLYFRAAIQKSDICVFLIHGYGDHSSRYQDLINELRDLPLSWFAFDLRGQGKSQGDRVYAESFNVFSDDLDNFWQFIVKRYPGETKRTLLLGHSLGGLIAARYTQQHPDKVRGLILTSPCFQTAGISWSPPLQWIGAFLDRIAPRVILTNFLIPKYLFRNEQKMTVYRQDSLIERRISARLGHLILEACKEAQMDRFQIACPVLVLASGDDHIVNLEATERWFSRLEASSKEMKIYPKLYHEIFNESDHDEPLAALKTFLLNQAEV